MAKKNKQKVKIKRYRKRNPRKFWLLTFVIFIVLIAMVLAMLAVLAAFAARPATSVTLTLKDYVTGEDISDEVLVRPFLIKSEYAGTNMSGGKLYDLAYFDTLCQTTADNISYDLSTRNILWIEIIAGQGYGRDMILIGANGDYTNYVFPLSSSVNHAILNSTLDPYVNATAQALSLYFSLPAAEVATKCQASLYIPSTDTKKLSTSNNLGRVTEALAFQFTFNATITNMASIVITDTSYVKTAVLNGTTSIFIVIMDSMVPTFNPVKFTLNMVRTAGNVQIGLVQTSSVRLTIPSDDNTGISVAQTYQTKIA